MKAKKYICGRLSKSFGIHSTIIYSTMHINDYKTYIFQESIVTFTTTHHASSDKHVEKLNVYEHYIKRWMVWNSLKVRRSIMTWHACTVSQTLYIFSFGFFTTVTIWQTKSSCTWCNLKSNVIPSNKRITIEQIVCNGFISRAQ